MAVLHEVRPAVTVLDEAPPSAARDADLEAVCLFLRAQTAWLRRALTRADDRVAVDVVIAAHDRSHARWLDLLAEVTDDFGPAAAQHVAALYGFHGRLVGSLERGAVELLEPRVAASARRLLDERLDELTGQALDALRRAAANPEPRGGVEQSGMRGADLGL